MNSIREIDFEITEDNGPRHIGGMIDLAKRTLDTAVRTILCSDGSGNEAIVLADAGGVARTYEFRSDGHAIESEVEELIRLGVDYRVVVERGEEVPMVSGAKYPSPGDMRFMHWLPKRVLADGYDPWRYFDKDCVYLGRDSEGVEPVFFR